MISNEKVNIEIKKNNLALLSKRYNLNLQIGDIIEVDIESLPVNSGLEVDAICDICKSDIKIKYKLYNKSFIKNGSFACSKKCAAVRTKDVLMKKYGVSNISQVPFVKDLIKESNNKKYGSDYYFGSDISKEVNKNIFLEKYGVDNPLKSEEVKEKAKKTNLEKWGTEWTLQNTEVREKIKKTSLEKWGSETPSKNDSVKNKIINTNITRWGGRSPMSNELIKNKSKKTSLNNWGVDNPNKSEEVREITKKTNLKKYGVEYPSQSEAIREKIKASNLKNWGNEHVHLSERYRVDNTIIGSDEFYIKYKGNGTSIFYCDNKLNHSFEINTDNYFSRKKQNIPLCTVCFPIDDKKSYLEIDLFNYISHIYSGKIIQSWRDGLEIDIYLPELNIGFEFNGLYWHSEEFRERNYHLNKTNYFKEKGIRIIHIWEDDWQFKKDVIKSQLRNWIGLNTNKISARNCYIREVSSIDARNFLNQNHIQGFVNSSIKIGLFHNEELVSLMTFDQFEGRKKMEEGCWNLSRFCNKLDLNVVGSASKLLKYFKDNYSANSVISYADKDWSQGNLYLKLGFKLISDGKPDYKYLVNGRRDHKSRWRKSKFKKDLTENEYTRSININKIWDCGKLKFYLSL
jgi:hypothetical protein